MDEPMPRANASAQVVGRGGEMQQREERARPTDGAGEINLRHDEEGDENRQRFFQTAGVKRKHRKFLSGASGAAGAPARGPEEQTDGEAQQ